MKLLSTAKPRLPRDYDLGVYIIFIIITIVFVLSFTQSDFGKDLVESIEINRIEGN